jgi:2-dehydro-3-deoxygluconokinase
MKKLITFGEILGRFTAPGHDRFIQAMPGSIDCSFAGAEANVAVSYAFFGGASAFITALPDHALGDAVATTLRRYSVDTRFIVRAGKGRLGLYFVETGANQRPGRVIYDREHSCISLAATEAFDFAGAFKGASWFHTTGITPALSSNAAASAIAAVRKAKEHGLTVSCDLNFRNKLWKWKQGVPARELASTTMRQILPFVDVLIGNEADIEDVLGIRAGNSATERGHLDINAYPAVASKVVEAFPNIRRVAITLRESLSASHNNWSAMLFDTEADQAFFAPIVDGKLQPYAIRNIIDRVGAGDSFSGALIWAMAEGFPEDPESAVGFATAASCLAHSIRGDFNLNSFEEVEQLRKGNASGRVQR